jgi:hypothetical protein
MSKQSIFRQAIELHKDGYTAIDFGTKESFKALQLKKKGDRNWITLDKHIWYALQALDKDPERKVDDRKST